MKSSAFEYSQITDSVLQQVREVFWKFPPGRSLAIAVDLGQESNERCVCNAPRRVFDIVAPRILGSETLYGARYRFHVGRTGIP